MSFTTIDSLYEQNAIPDLLLTDFTIDESRTPLRNVLRGPIPHGRKSMISLRSATEKIRDTSDPFDMHEEQFIDLFRISHVMARDQIEALRHHLQKEHSHDISVEVQVLAAIRFYSVGCYQRAIGQDWNLALSHISILGPQLHEGRTVDHHGYHSLTVQVFYVSSSRETKRSLPLILRRLNTPYPSSRETKRSLPLIL
uniref:Uncharacterized protein n=1 Tax=Timema monikensis TaxID=170555 RepID=A0A7R9EIX0_9NEOP|nr:unnamed protein product [Timema monikensis]